MRRIVTDRNTSGYTYPGNLAFYDNFLDTDGVLLENHTPNKGGPWVASRNGIEIRSNQAHFGTGTAPYIVDTNINLANCTMAALLYPTATGGDAGFCIRRTGAALTWHYVHLVSVGGVTGAIEIVRRTPLAILATSGNVSIIQGYPYIFQVDLLGNVITATIRGMYNEATTITVTDATNATTYTRGLFMGAHGVQIGEFMVTP